MSGIMQMLLAAVQRVTDPFFEYTTLLLPGNGTNGAQNNTFLDSSTNAFSITRNGNTTQGTFSPFSQTGWGNYFDGTGDYLTAGATSNFNFLHNSSALFTIEGWIYVPALGSGPVIFGTNSGTSSQVGTLFWIETTGELRLLIGKGSGGSPVVDATSSATVPVNQWCHVAVTYDQSQASSNCKFYINGTAAGTTNKTANAPSASNSAYPGTINAFGTSAAGACYLSSIRVNNSVVYASAFTPSTTPLTAITNTQLLTCQSNRFIDNSSNAFAITRNGDVSVQAFSPFNPTAAWSASTNGGSGYFDGSGDYLTAAGSTSLTFGTGDFTVEGWFYTASPATNMGLFQISTTAGGLEAGNTNNVAVYCNSSVLGVYYNDTFKAGTTAIRGSAWTHFALVRNSGTDKLYINGVADSGFGSSADTRNYTGGNIAVGGYFSNSYLWNGYISGFRVVKGAAVYTTDFTPPTAPPTAISNTQFLLNFTNAGIYDATSKNDLETVGNAQISTTQSKFGGSSMYFDGTGDYLFAPSSQNLNFRTGDFTIEGWIYLTSTADAYRTILYFTHSSGSSFFVRFGNNTSYNSKFQVGIAVGTASDVYSISKSMTDLANGWHHFALTRSGTTCRVFINGTQENVASGTNPTTFTNASFTNSTDINTSLGPEIGRGGAADTTFIGYINDLRVTRGYARYTSTFTPPTAAFPLL